MATRMDSQSFSACGLLLMLAVLEQVAGQSFRITQPPANATLSTGSTVLLSCGISAANYSGFFLWRTYSGSNVLLSSQVYTCPNLPSDPCTAPIQPPGPTMYTQYGSYGLNISTVDWTAGAWYGCRFQEGDVVAFASLVVIDQVVASFVEPTGLNSPATPGSTPATPRSASTTPGNPLSSTTTGSTTPGSTTPAIPGSSTLRSTTPSSALGATSTTPGTLGQHGQLGQLVCTVTYGSPTFTDAGDIQNKQPQVTMNFDGTVYTATSPNATLVYVSGWARQEKHNLTLTVTRPLTQNDIGKQLTCYVKTTNPAFSLQDSVQYPTDSSNDWELDLELPDNKAYEVNDTIVCAAAKHPNAQVRWVPLSDPVNTLPVYSTDLLLTESMLGFNRWKCALYDSSGRERNSTTISFNVTESSHHGESTDEDEEARRRLALGLGLGLGLGLLFLIILIIIIILCCIRRKNQQAPAKSKPGTATGASVSYVPLGADTEVAPPIYQAPVSTARPGSGGRNVSPAPSEEPSMNRSGHGDLGFKPASLPSRSNSHLNASIDRPLMSSPPQSGVRPSSGFADVAGTVNGRARSPYVAADRSQDSTSALSTSIRSSASSINPNRSGGPGSYRLAASRTGAATGV